MSRSGRKPKWYAQELRLAVARDLERGKRPVDISRCHGVSTSYVYNLRGFMRAHPEWLGTAAAEVREKPLPCHPSISLAQLMAARA